MQLANTRKLGYMTFSYAIDNRTHTLAEILNALLLDDPVREGLEPLVSSRLLHGAEPAGDT
jgi:hypothetical protein